MTPIKLFAILTVTCITCGFSQMPGTSPLKVFILAGQSNMAGTGTIEMTGTLIDRNGGKGTLEYLVENDPDTYGYLKDNSGNWTEMDDVWIYNEGSDYQGDLTVHQNGSSIGPELQFGHVMGEYFDNQVLLIKTAWGGKSLAVDFLSPSSASYSPPQASGDTGYFYQQMLSIVDDVLENLKTKFPNYDEAGYEIVGFGWHQGWNDRVNQAANDAYEGNMVNFINDVRTALEVENMPFSLANTGMSGWDEDHPRALSLMEAQLAMNDTVKYPDFAGNVHCVETRGFYRTPEESPSGQGFHWNRNAETYSLIGNGLAEAIKEMLEDEGRVGCMDRDYEEFDSLATIHDSSYCKTLGIAVSGFPPLLAYDASRAEFAITAPGTHHFRLYGLQGNLLRSKRGEGHAMYRLPALEPGIYVVQVAVGTAVYRRRVVVLGSPN